MGKVQETEKFQDIRAHAWEKIEENEPIYRAPDLDVLVTLTFNERTKWLDDRLPRDILEYGKYPPLGVEMLHKQGLTGEGVNVAIIDQPLALDHPEYSEQIVCYKSFAPDGYQIGISSMHGPAVASLLVGKDLGTAPKANLHYYAFPSWLKDSLYAAQALEDIIETNKTLDAKHKIKFVSVSASLSGKSSPFEKNLDTWDKAVAHAKNQGICVVDCSLENGFVGPGYVDFVDKSFKYGYPDGHSNMRSNSVHVPNSLRTVAESYDNKLFSYTYYGKGGLSWGIPYATGILCLGQQLNPNLSAEELKKILIQTAQKNNNVVNPEDFIDKVKDTLEK